MPKFLNILRVIHLEDFFMFIGICYSTLLNVLINKFTTGYSEEKVPRTLVVLKMAIQFREKKNSVHDL